MKVNSTSQPPLVLTDGQEKYPLGFYLEILKDPTGELTIEDVSSSAYDARFLPSRVEVPNLGFTNHTYWVRFHLKNNTGKTDRWFLELNFANLHYEDLFLPAPKGGNWIVKESGILRALSTRDAATHHIVLAIPLSPQQEGTYYIRFRSGASMTLPLILWQPEAFYRNLAAEMIFLGLFYGALLIMLVYHLFVLYSLRETSYLYFVSFLGSSILWLLAYDGLAAQYLWPNRAGINRYVNLVFALIAIASILMFVDSFLELKRRHPRLHRLIQVLAAGLGIGLLLVPFVSYHVTVAWAIPYAILSLIATTAAGFISWRSGYRPARFFLFAWLGLLAGIVFTFLIREGLAPSTRLSENIFRLGILWLAAFWSISLTDRVNLLKVEMENANRALRTSEHQLSQILEGLPLAVVVYGNDRRPSYGNKRTFEILTNPDRNIRPDISAGRTLEAAIQYYSLKKEGTDQPYPVEKFPVHSALLGGPAYADDIEVNDGDRRIPLEIWASPMKDEMGNTESAVVAFQDISQRKQEEAELIGYRNQLEALVSRRTTDLNDANEKLQLRLEWLSSVNKVHQSISGMESLETGYQELSLKVLQIFHAKLVFILRWESEEAYAEVLSCSLETGKPHDKKPLKELFEKDSPLREKIEQGRLITCPPEQTGSFSTSFTECFPDQEVPSLILAPIKLGPSVIGVLGVAVMTSSEDLLRQESDLVERMALDLSTLAQGVLLLDQAVFLATVEERNRLARELHDSVTQTLFTASVLAEATPHILEKDAATRPPKSGQAQPPDPRRPGRDAQHADRAADGRSAPPDAGTAARHPGGWCPGPFPGRHFPFADEGCAGAARKSNGGLLPHRKGGHDQHHGPLRRIAHIQVSLLEEEGRLFSCVQDDGCGFDRAGGTGGSSGS